MKLNLLFLLGIFFISMFSSCKEQEKTSDMNILYLHHSTGGVIWKGKKNSLITKVAWRISHKLTNLIGTKEQLPLLFKKFNKKFDKNYSIKEMAFPKREPYGWNNYPYDYYNIWVKNAGEKPYMEEPTLEMLTKDYQVIIFKHCFPVSKIQEDGDTGIIDSDLKTLANYKLQYQAIREKLHEFPATKFILFTGAVHVKSNITEEEANRMKEFYNWVVNEWDVPGDNIHLWDLYSLETEGGIYLNEEYAVSPTDSHPNWNFAEDAVKLLFNRIVDVIENNGNSTTLTGVKK